MGKSKGGAARRLSVAGLVPGRPEPAEDQVVDVFHTFHPPRTQSNCILCAGGGKYDYFFLSRTETISGMFRKRGMGTELPSPRETIMSYCPR